MSHLGHSLNFLATAILRKILDFSFKCEIFWLDKSVIFSLSESRFIRKGPLPNNYSTVHDYDRKLVSVLESESELLIEDRVNCILESNWWKIRRLDFIAKNSILCEPRVDWNLYNLQVNKGTVSVGYCSLFSHQLSTLVLVPDKTQLSSL